ncbi:MAG: SDR family NAD(P)-dependent oxidoreductase [Alphaproteobacteria bacterium]
MRRLDGKVALITGSGGGIGAEIAALFCAEGAAVLLVDADPKGLERVAAGIGDAVPAARVEGFVADVSDAAAASDAVGRAVAAYGQLDVLVNNAGIRNYASIAESSPDEWDSVYRVNLFGYVNYCRAAVPALRAAGKGSIVNISSSYAVTGRKGMAIYDSTKAAILALTRSLACEEAAQGIRVNAVCPGSTMTDFHIERARRAGKSVEELSRERSDRSILGRWATPREIALPVLWLASDEGSYITGTTLMVDGGTHAM